MCGCSDNSATTGDTAAVADGAVFMVEDMNCMHCVGTIRGALAEALPGAAVAIDLDTKRVTVPRDSATAAETAMRDAGYEPQLIAA